MLKASLIIISVCGFFLSNAQSPLTRKQKVAAFQNMQWLIGSWKGEYNNKPFYEAWRKVNDSVFVNFGIEINGIDTVVKEAAPLLVSGDHIYLGKRDGAHWIMVSADEKKIVLKNDTLKYSNLITWEHTANDHWYTTLKHPKSTAIYDMVRVPELEAVVDRFIAGARK